MRQANNKRVRGRSSGGRRSPNGANRSYESNGPETKIRGTAMQVYEKYCALARDAGVLVLSDYLDPAKPGLGLDVSADTLSPGLVP